MKKLFTPFVFLAITGMMTACGESLVGPEELESPDELSTVARELDCEEGWPTPNSFFCGDEGGEG
jgi:hypothetical protein